MSGLMGSLSVASQRAACDPSPSLRLRNVGARLGA